MHGHDAFPPPEEPQQPTREHTMARLRFGLALAAALPVTAALLALGQPRVAPPRVAPPGEWRYWGADAWSTRYSPLDQIGPANFDSLQVAWQWNAGEYGE